MGLAFIGVYHYPKLFEIGLSTYLEQMIAPDRVFGDLFSFAPLGIEDENLVIYDEYSVFVTKEEAQKSVSEACMKVKTRLPGLMQKAQIGREIIGAAVASPNFKKKQVFQSTWYTLDGFLALLRLSGFTEEEFEISLIPKGKGIMANISYDKSNKLVTSLNNVIGCVYYKNQIKELRKIVQMLKE